MTNPVELATVSSKITLGGGEDDLPHTVKVISQKPVINLNPYSGPPNAALIDYLESYEQLAKHSGWSDEEKVNYLACYLANDTQRRYLQMVASGALSQKWPELRKGLEEWALPTDHEYELLNRIDHFRQGNLRVDEYINKMSVYCAAYKKDMTTKEMLY